MKHSFVVACHGESKYLPGLLRSLNKQSLPSEIILASSEDTPYLREISERYGLPLEINPNGGSIGKDWNFCLEIAPTPLVTIAHQDDIYLRAYTAFVENAFLEDPGAAICFTDYREIRGNMVVEKNLNLGIKEVLLSPFKHFPNRVTQLLPILFGSAICCPSVTYNKDVLENFSFDEVLRSDLDWQAWIEIYKRGEKFIYVPEILMLHRIHENSETSKIIEDNARTEEDRRMLEQLWPKKIAGLISKVYSLSQRSNFEDDV